MNDILEKIKAFGMTNQMITEDLQRIESHYNCELGHLQRRLDVEEVYYPQFDAHVRNEAASMSRQYEVFYCLEKTIRALIAETLESSAGQDWWETKRVPDTVKLEVKSRIQKELDSGITRRSFDELDYTTFGELSVIITSNWELFGGLFSSRKALEKVMASLNSLRGPIAHCSPLAEDEVLRLQLTVRDWFRLMEKPS